MSPTEEVILVDATDRPVGTAEKLAAHRAGHLHRAFSVVIRDRPGRLLLQKRAAGKYHSGGLWTNACCGHPRPGEETAAAAGRRLAEEMGIACPLRHLVTTTYHAELDHGMIEHELVHVFAGRHDGPIRPDPAEADGFAWVEPAVLRREIAAAPERYTVWFRKYVGEHWPSLTADPAWDELGEPA
jgi:isopentenyl-diphosphate delta-isomerase